MEIGSMVWQPVSRQAVRAALAEIVSTVLPSY